MKPNWIFSVVCSVGCFVVGVVLGTVVFGARGETAAPLAPPEQATPAVQMEARRAEPVPVQRPVEMRPENGPKPGARARALADLNSCVRRKLRVPLVDFDDKLNPDFLAVFDVTPSERAQLEAAVAEAKNGIAQLEKKYAVIKPGAAGEFSITIPAFPEEGGAIYDEFGRSIREVLGEERYAAYQGSDGGSDSHLLGTFGAADTLITVSGPGAGAGRTTMRNRNGRDGTISTTIEIGPLAFAAKYPELARKMVADGLWQMPVGTYRKPDRGW